MPGSRAPRRSCRECGGEFSLDLGVDLGVTAVTPASEGGWANLHPALAEPLRRQPCVAARERDLTKCHPSLLFVVAPSHRVYRLTGATGALGGSPHRDYLNGTVLVNRVEHDRSGQCHEDDGKEFRRRRTSHNVLLQRRTLAHGALCQCAAPPSDRVMA